MRQRANPAIGLFGAFALLAIAGCGSSSASPTPVPATPTTMPTVPSGPAFSAALVTDVGGIHDRSYNQMAWTGLQTEKRRAGISILLAESRRAADYLPALRRFAQHYATITFAVGYSMSRAVYTAALEFPAARFAMVDARPIDTNGREVSLNNVANLFFREQESGYLAGVIAGLMEKNHVGKATHDVIGYLGGGHIAMVDQYLAGYIAGAQKVNPTIHVIGQYATSFTDPKAGTAIGHLQIAQGADILFQVAARTGTGYLEAARKSGVYGIGVDTDEGYLGPFVLTSAIKRVNAVVRRITDDLVHNQFAGGDHVLGGSDGATGFGRPSSLVPAAIVAQARSVQKRIDSGALIPPATMPVR
jgi:basic membrane protein A